MDLNGEYFSDSSRGFKIIYRFYLKYRDLFSVSIFPELADFKNQIYLNIAGIKLTDVIRNEEAYLIGAIKIQCRVQLDKALKFAKEKPESLLTPKLEEEEGISITENLPAVLPDPHEILEGEEVLNCINIFKLQLRDAEKNLLNGLIDEKTRAEIAEENKLNMNTLDTNIRRLRIKFFSFLKENGYKYDMFRKYEGND